MDNFAEDETARHRVVARAARFRERRRVDQDVGHELAVAQVVQIQRTARQIRHPGAVGQHLTDGDPVLAISFVSGDVLGDRVVEVNSPRSASCARRTR